MKKWGKASLLKLSGVPGHAQIFKPVSKGAKVTRLPLLSQNHHYFIHGQKATGNACSQVFTKSMHPWGVRSGVQIPARPTLGEGAEGDIPSVKGRGEKKRPAEISILLHETKDIEIRGESLEEVLELVKYGKEDLTWKYTYQGVFITRKGCWNRTKEKLLMITDTS